MRWRTDLLIFFKARDFVQPASNGQTVIRLAKIIGAFRKNGVNFARQIQLSCLCCLLGRQTEANRCPVVWILSAVRRGGQSSTRVSALGACGRRGLSSEGSQVLKCSHYHRAWSLYRALNPRGGVTEDRSHASRVTEDRGGRIFKMRCLQSQAIVTPAASRALSWGGIMRRHGKTIPQFHAMKPRKQRCARDRTRGRCEP